MTKLIYIGIVFFILGLGYFYINATFDNPIWDMRYGIWARNFDLGLIWWVVLYFKIEKPYRRLIRWLIIFAAARVGLEVVSGFTGIGVNNHWAVAALFVILICGLSIILFEEFKKIEKHL